MKWGVVTFPGSLDDCDALYCLETVLGQQVVSLWHKDRDLHGVEAIILPGGFSYGDYLRCGAIARFSPIMHSVIEFANAGGPVMGMCNGFQILCESGLLPGALIRNNLLSYRCEWVRIRVETTHTTFTAACRSGEILRIPIKHGEGCYVADEETLKRLEDNGQIVFRYVNEAGEATEQANPNGALHNIAGVANTRGNVVGLMPHPEHAVEALLGGEDGRKLFLSALAVKNL
ncbi:MAG TPA: phosphoribosylformylglycinamidine synthase subunit PurQ [Methylomirabilota bacterium]|nr:phosphoribosylformylglycinamidine synthase subunit PurQ [Methylomirabilota bacterium]